MTDMYVGSAQVTFNIYSKNSAYRFENAKIEISTSLFGLGWETRTIIINLTDRGSGEKTVTMEYDFMLVPDAPEVENYLVSDVEGFVII